MTRARILASLLALLLISTAGASRLQQRTPDLEVPSGDDSTIATGMVSTREALLRAKEEILAHHYFAGDMIRTAPLYRALAEICAELGQYDEAERWYDKILAFNSFEITTLVELADMHLERPDPDPARADSFLVKAEMAAERLYRGTEEEARVRRSRGRYHMIRHEYARARAQFALAIEYWGDEAPLDLLHWNAESALDDGDYAESLRLYLDLIGRTKGLDRRALEGFDEVNSLALEPLEESEDVLIARAIEAAEHRKSERLREIGGRVVTIDGADGFPVTGSFFHPAELPAGNAAPAPRDLAILLVPAPGESRGGWNGAASLLLSEGYTVLTVDLRGFGDSRTPDVSGPNGLGPAAAELWERDVRGALGFLTRPEINPSSRVAIVSVANGCGVCALAAHRNDAVEGLVFISPLFDFDARSVMNTLQYHRSRRLYCLGSQEDLASLRQIHRVMKLEGDPSRRSKTLYLGAGHGLEILEREPGSLARLLAWADDLDRNGSPP